jgi:hypothetical protein
LRLWTVELTRQRYSNEVLKFKGSKSTREWRQMERVNSPVMTVAAFAANAVAA